MLVFAVLIWVDRRFKIGHGRLFALYVAGYCLGRFWIELMRSDRRTHIAGIRINSFTSTFVFIGAVVYIMVAPKGREDPATLKGKPRDVDGKPTVTAEKDASAEKFAKELTGVAAATTGVVAAAKVAGQAEDEDAKAVGGEGEDELPEVGAEAAGEAEALAYDVAEAPSEDIAEAEEFAAAGQEVDSVDGVGAVEAEDAEAAVEEAETEPSDEDAAGEAESVAKQAEESDEQEPGDEVPAREPEPKPDSVEEPAESAEGAQTSGGRLRRWLRGSRG